MPNRLLSSRMSNNPRILVGIPMYNEVQVARSVLKDVFVEREKCPFEFDVLIVNDGSTDGTESILASFSKLQIVDHQSRQGVGAALKTALNEAVESEYDYFLWHVGNGRVQFKDSLSVLRAVINGADYSHGSRFMKGGGWSKSAPFSRRISLKIGNLLVGFLNSRAPTDITCGIRAVRVGNLGCVDFPSKFSDGYGGEQEFCIAMLKSNNKVVEVPIFVYERPERPNSHFRWHHVGSVVVPWLKSLIKRGRWQFIPKVRESKTLRKSARKA